ncbi:Fanconi anemia group A protein isoform X1 [Alosa pseudoharengus]|uniref:Fanconi anemia group A protein isoform X1 n=1 Tax=Alosa pseudoharengus TaxID=34774 RepID=UPI003F8C1CAD
MSLEPSSVLAPSQKTSLSSLLASRAGKRPREHLSGEELQEAAIQLLNSNQNLSDLLLEVGQHSPKFGKVDHYWDSGERDAFDHRPDPVQKTGASFLLSELKRQSQELGVPVGVLSVKVVLERVLELTTEGDEDHVLLTSAQRAQLCVLLQSTRELLSLGTFSPRLLWQEYWKAQPKLEVIYHLHAENILALEDLFESNDDVGSWLVKEFQALCGLLPSQEEEELTKQKILSTVMCALVRGGFEEAQDTASSSRRFPQRCCSVLDNMLSWLLDSLSSSQGPQEQEEGKAAAMAWVGVFEACVSHASVLGQALRRFSTRSLTHILTHCPRLKVSDAIAMQNNWTFAKTNPLLTSLFCKLCVLFSMEELLSHLQQVLETHEVNWQHVLSCLSTLLVYHSDGQPCLKEMLSRLLSLAFEVYDLESMITAFLLARQGALEGSALFPSYSDWFKLAFGGASGYHGNSKKSLVFLLKFLSDLVPFDPPQYLKVHILHPPYVPAKHRALLQEYVSLAKTRLADLKVSVEEMGLYEDVTGAAPTVLPQHQAQQDVEKAISLFESTGKISAMVMEASIFRRPYFLSRFLPALLTPRVLPVKADARMNFIEALRRADKIPSAVYSSYTDSCHSESQRQQCGVVRPLEGSEAVLAVLRSQLQELRRLLSSGANHGDVSAQLARISDTLSGASPEPPEEAVGHHVIQLQTGALCSNELQTRLVNALLRGFCQCLLDASKANPPNRQGTWAAQFVKLLLGHRRLLTSLLHRLWDLLPQQGPSLGAAHVLGLAALLVQLHAAGPLCPMVQLPSSSPTTSSSSASSSSSLDPCGPLPVSEALNAALLSHNSDHMNFSLRFCVAAVSYGLCSSHPEGVQQCIPSGLYKKLVYLVPRLVPEARAEGGCKGRGQPEHLQPGGGAEEPGVWSCLTDPTVTLTASVLELWRYGPFRSLQKLPAYQLSFPEWLALELRVQRSQDALSDPQRQEYEQWACEQLYLPTALGQGGCGGDVQSTCTHILNAVMDMSTRPQSWLSPDHSVPLTDTCLPDVLSRLQEMVCELQMTLRFQSSGRADGHFLFDVVAGRCSKSPDSQDLGSELSLQQTLHTWNRVILALPALSLIPVKTEGAKRSLDCQPLIEHVNLYQRKVCSPAGLLPYPLTAHFLRGIVGASMCCERPAASINRAVSQISQQCPLLLASAGHWWGHLSPVLGSQWNRGSDGDFLPEKLQQLADCHSWACRWVSSSTSQSAVPSAPALLLAACLHQQWTSGLDISPRSSPERLAQLQQHHRPMLVFLLFFCMSDLLTAYLAPQGAESVKQAQQQCCDILTLLVDSADWLHLFHSQSTEQNQYQSATIISTEENNRLMPLAFYSLVPSLDAAVLNRAVSAPRFLYTAVLSYCKLLQLFLDGETPKPRPVSSQQMDVSQVLSRAQQVLLKIIILSSPGCLTHTQRTELEELCGELDPEVAATLSMQLSPPDLSQEMDF